jgi:transposase-like protein
VLGVSTRRVDDLVRTMGIDGISRSEVSRICAALDAEVTTFRTRPLGETAFPYLRLDATVRHEAPHDRVGWKGPPATCRSRSVKLRAA